MISVVIPVYNEEANLPILRERLEKSSPFWKDSFEVIFVDDGSTDRTPEILKKIHQEDRRFKALTLARNFGHQTALSAGLKYANGDAVVVMDADLQDPPEVIQQFLEKWREGYEVVFAVRKNRKEFWLKKAAYWIFYRVLAWASEIKIPLDAGDFCVMDQKVVRILNAMKERNRFIRGLRSWIGFRQTGVAYERDARYAGSSKYSLGKLFKLAFDGMISFSFKPLRIFGLFGFFVAFGSLAVLALFILAKIFNWNLTPYGLGNIPGYFPLFCVILFIGGVQLIGLGLFGEYLGRTYDEVKARPSCIIKEAMGFPATAVL